MCDLITVYGCFYRLDSLVFFKQKTAYEMRISDWSSNVCSSDLVLLQLFDIERLDVGLARQPLLALGGALAGGQSRQRQQGGNEKQPCLLREIGRASCRERVCQYV